MELAPDAPQMGAAFRSLADTGKPMAALGQAQLARESRKRRRCGTTRAQHLLDLAKQKNRR